MYFGLTSILAMASFQVKIKKRDYTPCFDAHGVPMILHWSVTDVAFWIKEAVGLPQYEECFVANYINGRKLILIDATNLPKIGITDFEHIKQLTAKVREMLGIEVEKWNRSIASPPRDPISHFLERKSHSGDESDSLTFDKHLRYLRTFSDHK